MMNERYLLGEINRRVSEAVSFAEALESIQLLLEEEIGRAILFVRFDNTASPHLRENTVTEFLASREFPFRAVYTSSFDASGGQKAVLIGCFGSWGSNGNVLERATAHAAGQLGSFLGRTSRELHVGNEAA
jgi:hypothetical protein